MKAWLAALAALAAWGCTPQAALLSSLVPEGTVSTLLSHTQRVEDANRRKIAELERSGDWSGLARFAEENIKRDAHTPDWWIVAGFAYTQQNEHARAAERFLEAVRLQPDVTLPWTLLAQSYRAAGDSRRAALTLQNALLARRDDAQLYWLLGEAESDLQRWGAAAAAYRSALGMAPDHAPAWRGLQRAYEASGRIEEAREAQRALEALNAKTAPGKRTPK